MYQTLSLNNDTKEVIENISEMNINRNYRRYSVSNYEIPLYFVPIIKPKNINFEEETPFLLQSSDIENDVNKTNSTFCDSDEQKNLNKIDFCKRNKSNSFDNHILSQKKKLNTILRKLEEKNQLKHKEN